MDPPSASNEIVDFDTTLNECGFHGASKEEPQDALLFYDFKPRISDSLLLAEPASWRFGEKPAEHAHDIRTETTLTLEQQKESKLKLGPDDMESDKHPWENTVREEELLPEQ